MAARDDLHFATHGTGTGICYSQQLVHLVQRRKEDHQVVGVLVADILHLLARFSNLEFS